MLKWDELETIIDWAQSPLPDEPWLESINRDSNGQAYPYYRLLYLVARSLGPASCCLEIGVESGIGSAHMAMGALRTGNRAMGIDLNQPGLLSEILSRCPNYSFHPGDATSPTARQWVKDQVGQYGWLGLVYQDSSHHFLESVQEWAAYSPLLRQGLWLCDDITPSFFDPLRDPPGCGMVRYFEAIPQAEKRLFPNILHPGNVQGAVLICP